jgi:hypothetical protein
MVEAAVLAVILMLETIFQEAVVEVLEVLEVMLVLHKRLVANLQAVVLAHLLPVIPIT